MRPRQVALRRAAVILTLAVAGYRSLRSLVLPLGPLTVVTGANGAGKSSLYRALRLLADVAHGRAIAALAAEGGLSSVLWAGPESVSAAVKAGGTAEGTVRRERVALKLGFASEDFGYAIDLGLPIRDSSMFARDPEVKAEAVWAGPVLRRSNTLAERRGPAVTVLSGRSRAVVAQGLPPYVSMMTHAADPAGAPELLALRERMAAFRFYDHLRTDGDAPARRPVVGTRTPALAGTGADLAPALQTIREIGDADGLDAAVEAAFPGASVWVEEAGGLFSVAMRQHGLLRPLGAAELSDGTLRYLMLLAALKSPRPPPTLVLNEPETSLNPALLPPLAALVADASARGQVVVVTHAAPLVDALAAAGATVLTLEKSGGETVAPDVEEPAWSWPTRR